MIDDPVFYLATIPAVVLTGLSKDGLHLAVGRVSLGQNPEGIRGGHRLRQICDGAMHLFAP
jgi:hypothetical protein